MSSISVILFMSPVNAADDIGLQGSFSSILTTKNLFNFDISSQTKYLHAESFLKIPESFLTSSLHRTRDELVSFGFEMNFPAGYTSIQASKSSSLVVSESRSGNSLENVLLFGSYPSNTEEKIDSFNITFSQNFTDIFLDNLYSTKQESRQNFKSSKPAAILRWDTFVNDIFAGFYTDSRSAALIKTSSICWSLLESSTFTKDIVTFNDKNITETNLRLENNYSTSSSFLTTVNGQKSDINFLIVSKDTSKFKESPGVILSKLNERKYSKCGPENLSMSELSNKEDENKIKSITIANVSGYICHYAECLEGSVVCMCDQKCLIYKDCCLSYLFQMIRVNNIDLDGNKIISEMEATRERFLESYSPTLYQYHEFIISYTKCVLSKEQGFLLIGLCPASSSNEKEKQKCELSGNEVGIHNVPVVHYDPFGISFHFKNAYCALCHNISVFDFRFWNVQANCDGPLTDNFNYSDVPDICDFEVTPPEDTNIDLRTCIPNIFPPKECELKKFNLNNINHSEHDILSICQSYVSPIEYKGVSYRNMHCATCLTGEREFLSSNSCFSKPPFIMNKVPTPGFNPRISLKIIFDFSLKEGLVVRSMCDMSLKINCLEKQMYDCLTRTCRTIYCLDEQAVTDNCVPLYDTPWQVSPPATEQFVKIHYEAILSFETKGSGTNMTTNNDTEHYIAEVEKFVRSLDVVKTFNITSCDIVFQPVTLYASLKITVLLTLNISLSDFLTLIDTIRSRENKALVSTFTSIIVKNYQNESELNCKDGDLYTTSEFTLTHVNATLRFYLTASKILAYVHQIRFKLSILPTGSKTESIFYCWLNLTKNIKCRLVFLSENEYRLENGSLYLINTTNVYKNGTYVLGNSGAYVCFNTLIGFEKIFKMFDYSQSQWILSIITKTLSVAALLSIVFFHAYFPNLRNLHGLNLMTLSATLLFADCISFVYHIPTGIACQVTGILLHFLWLSVFAWLNVIGFDVTRAFQSGWMSATSHVRRRFRKYFIIAFGMPLLLVTICIIFHVNNGPVMIDYGTNNQCWLGNQKAVIIFFLAPIIMSVLINTFFLGMTIYFIERAKKMSQHVKSRRDTVYCLIYFKLTVILGFSWVVGIIAVFVDIPELWYVHIILNGLQGLCLFICFILNARFLRAMTKGPSEIRFSTKVMSSTKIQINGC